jgi:hypothetical protein
VPGTEGLVQKAEAKRSSTHECDSNLPFCP